MLPWDAWEPILMPVQLFSTIFDPCSMVLGQTAHLRSQNELLRLQECATERGGISEMSALGKGQVPALVTKEIDDCC